MSRNTYRWRDEFGDSLVEDLVPLDGVVVLGDEEHEKCVRAVVEVLVGEGGVSDGVLLVRKALDAEDVPRPKSVVQTTFHFLVAATPHAQGLDWVPSEGEG